MRSNTARKSIAATLGAAALLLGGCSSGPPTSYQRAAQIRDNPTPQLVTLSQREVDLKNDWALMVDENMRMMREDIRRFWLINRPSRLTRYPIPR